MATNNAGNIPTGAANTVLQGQGVGTAPAFSTATYPATATGTGTILRADGTNWSATTSTYPNTNAVSTLLYASASNVMGALATANDGLLVTSNTGVPSILAGPGTTGNILQSNAAAAPSFSTATYPSTATGTGKILRADGTNWVASTATYPDTAGTSGNVLTSDGTNWTSSAPASTFAPNSTIQLFDDFIIVTPSNSVNYFIGNQGWLQNAGFWTQGATLGNSGHYGVLANAAYAVSSAFMMLGCVNNSASVTQNQLILGGGAITINWIVNIVNLSSGTNRYTLRLGLGDTNSADQANGVYFEYSDNINSGNWVYKSAAASSRTTSNSSTAVATGYHNFQITINAAATSVSFSVDGVSLGTAISTNIPTLGITPFFDATRSAGTIAAGTFLVDLFYMTQTLTTPR